MKREITPRCGGATAPLSGNIELDHYNFHISLEEILFLILSCISAEVLYCFYYPPVYSVATMSSPLLDMFSLKGQTAIVTGCTRGIGQQMAIALAEAGARLIFVQVSPNILERTLKLTTSQRSEERRVGKECPV